MPESRNLDSAESQSRGGGPPSHRGGRHRRGRRGGPQALANRDGSETAENSTSAGPSSSGPAIPSPSSSGAGSGPQPSTGRGRGRGAGRGRRGGSASQASALISHRTFGGHLTSHQEGAASSSTTLSGDAPEFVPGRPPVLQADSNSNHVIPGVARGAATAVSSQTTGRRNQTTKPVKSTAADLPTRIHEDIDNGLYECVICTNEVVRTSRIWSCSICWTVTHLHCVKKWHSNQSKTSEQGQTQLSWRCPGCNSPLLEDPGSSTCWCGKEVNPRPIPGLTSHSCGQTCSKTRPTCPHPCTLMCHAGSCPPCQLMGEAQACFCGKHSSTKRCSETEYGKGWSCQEVCGDLLSCGEHACPRQCHSGLCGSCDLSIPSVCYCGKESKDIVCEQREEALQSFNFGQVQDRPPTLGSDASPGRWFQGSFQCDQECGRKFDCGQHTCRKPCHAQDELPGHCPYSPDVVLTCPCGKTTLQEIMSGERRSCQDEIPYCGKYCGKHLDCGHYCPDKCHSGACDPCTQPVEISCTCGRTTTSSACHNRTVVHPQCSRICRALLSCGRHECGKQCCSGEKQAAQRQAAKRKHNRLGISGEIEEEHRCLEICGRPLKCGNHNCDLLCHRGACASCPEAVFEEISCPCGGTVLQPPQPCGTRPPECRFPCAKPPPCGHPAVKHNCHPAETPCPKCPFLVERACVCGKKMLKNQPCWFEEPRCGIPCEKKLKCGAHECAKTCHNPGQCEDAGIVGSHCTQPCGKPKRCCDHMCSDQCHAPYPCKEDRPCESKTFITCECQNRKLETICLATKSRPWPTREPLKCDDECLRLARNRRLAEALKIDPETHTDNHIPYSDTTISLFKENITWAQTQEREFRVFASDPNEKRLRFKPMPPPQRAFLHALAEDFGLDSQSQDPEGHRHVCIFKTPRFVSAPMKTLGQCLAILGTPAAQVRSLQAAKPWATDQHHPFNAFLLEKARFGLTVEELDGELAGDLAISRAAALTFHTSFLPSEEIVVKASLKTTAAAIAASPAAMTPQAVESVLRELKPAVAKTVSRLGLAGSVTLCHADSSLNIVQREGEQSGAGGGGAGKWSIVVGRSANRAQARPVAVEEQRAPSTFVALRKEPRPKQKAAAGLKEEAVEEDWLAAAEKLDGGDVRPNAPVE